MSFIQRLFRGRADDAARIAPLYRAAVDHARQPHWYVEGAVPDTVDGRFDMIAAVLSVVLIRLEREPAGQLPSTHLAEAFVDDMDGQLREIGIGDVVVGKHVGKMMSALGGRLSAYREALAGDGLEAALVRNLYRGEAPAPEAVAHVAASLGGLSRSLDALPLRDVLDGRLA